MNTYQKIKQLRVLLDLTQADMAEKLDMSQKAYSKYENGKTQLTEQKIKKITSVLGICPNQLRKYDENLLLRFLNGDTKPDILSDRERQFYETRLEEKKTEISWLKERIEKLEGNNVTKPN